MEVKQTNFVTHLIITVQLYYWLSKNPSVKIWSNKFQMVTINYSKLCVFLLSFLNFLSPLPKKVQSSHWKNPVKKDKTSTQDFFSMA